MQTLPPVSAKISLSEKEGLIVIAQPYLKSKMMFEFILSISLSIVTDGPMSNLQILRVFLKNNKIF